MCGAQNNPTSRLPLPLAAFAKHSKRLEHLRGVHKRLLDLWRVIVAIGHDFTVTRLPWSMMS
jgi:hypothetical protein